MISQNLFFGMDLDTSYQLRDNKKYFKLDNGELVSNEENSGGMIVNAKGNKLSFKFPSIDSTIIKNWLPSTTYSDIVIVGAVSIEDYIVLATTIKGANEPNNGSAGDCTGNTTACTWNISMVWAFRYDRVLGNIPGLDPSNELNQSIHLIYYDRLNFSINHPVKIIGNQETNSIIKIYLADGVNNIRQMNILEVGLLYKEPSYLELLNKSIPVSIKTKVQESGSFNSGTVQYSIQLYNKNGAESKFFPPGNMVNLSLAHNSLPDTSSFNGTEYIKDQNVGKSTVIQIDPIVSDYEYIRIVRIYYYSEYAAPEITIIYDFKIPINKKLTVSDDGIIARGIISHEEFVSAGGTLFSAEDLTTVKNMLVAANIKEDFYDVDYDARSYRFDLSGTTSKIYQSDGTFYTIDNLGNWTKSDTFVTGVNWTLPIDVDAINNDATTYKYQATNGTSVYGLGGVGANVEYFFGIKKMTIDSTLLKATDQSRKHAVPSINWSFNNPFYGGGYLNYAGVVNSSLYVGYQRMETYRFGIVFFDDKGRQSFVKWICDIKMPASNDEDLRDITTMYNTVTATTINTNRYDITSFDLMDLGTYGIHVSGSYSNNIYLNFKVKNIPSTATAFQIVRVARKDSDKTVLGAGLLLPVHKGGTTDASTMTDYVPVGGMRTYKETAIYGASDSQAYNTQSVASATLFGQTVGATDPDSGVLYGTENQLQDTVYSNRLFNLVSPEISFYRDSNQLPSKIILTGIVHDKIGINGTIVDAQLEWSPDAQTASAVAPVYEMLYKTCNIERLVFTSEFIIDKNLIPTYKSKEYVDIGGQEQYKHHINWTQLFTTGHHIWHKAYAGVSLIGRSTTDISVAVINSAAFQKYDIAYVYMYRDALQYGGKDYQARVTNKYIPVSDIIPVSSYNYQNPIEVFGGDSYIAMYEHTLIYNDNDTGARTMTSINDLDWKRDKTQMNSIIFPVETTVNIDWRTDKSYTRASGNKRIINEKKGLYNLLDNDNVEQYYTQEADAYTINYTYMRNNNVSEYFPDRLHSLTKTTEYNHRILTSKEKFDNEFTDSWLKFLPNDYIDIEGTSGPINAIEAISGHLYTFQTNGISMIDVRRESLITDNTGKTLELGSGNLFSAPQYLTKRSGTRNRLSIVKGENAIYFYDTVNKDIGIINSQGHSNLSERKHISKYLNKHISDNFYDGDTFSNSLYVIAGFNNNDHNVYFTFSDKLGESFTLSFNEQVNSFISFHSFIPTRYICNNNLFISIAEDSILKGGEVGWIHSDDSVKGSYYNAQIESLILSYIVSDKPLLTKVFDTLEYNHLIEDINGVVDSQNTFDSITISNSLETVTNVLVDSKYRFRTWRMNLPRVSYSGRLVRFSGKYANIELTYNNSNNKTITVYPIVTHWRPMNIMMNR